MKIAVYSICKNESKFVQQFTESIKEADAIIVADTGSTDDTVARLADTPATVYRVGVKPWRFDTPRNVALSLVPADFDVCIKMDLDEVMRPGWRDLVEKFWQPTTSRLRYFMADGWNGVKCTTEYPKSDVHARHGYLWRYPCHESLCWVNDGEEVTHAAPGLVVEHRQDHSKPRSSYLPLLQVAVTENPGPRHWFWLGREYAYAERWAECEATMQKLLDLPEGWEMERAWGMRFIADSHHRRGNHREAVKWYTRACGEAPDQRELWMHLAEHHRLCNEWEEAYAAALRGLVYKRRPSHYLAEAKWWGAAAHDLAAFCAWKAGNPDAARRHILNAVAVDPGNDRMIQIAKRIGAVLGKEPYGGAA